MKLMESYTAYIDSTTRTLSFSPDSSFIQTDAGVFPVGSLLQHESELQPQILPLGYGISEDRSWINFCGQPLLWLPPGFRPTKDRPTLRVHDGLLALGCESGRLLSMELGMH
jgi:hypothetical protein